MPLGASRLSFLAKTAQAAAPAGSNWNNYDGTANGSYTQVYNGSTTTTTISTAMFDDTYGIVVYCPQTSPYDVYYKVVTVSGTTVSLGSQTDTTADAHNINVYHITKLSDTRIVLLCSGDAANKSAVIFEHTGSGSVSITKTDLSSGSAAANSLPSIVRMSDTTFAHIGRRSGSNTVLTHYTVNTSTNAVTETGYSTFGSDFDQYLVGIRIDNDSIFVMGRTASDTTYHGYAVYDFNSGSSSWSRNGSVTQFIQHSGVLPGRPALQQHNNNSLMFFAKRTSSTAGEVGIDLYAVDYNGGSPQVSSALSISEATITANADGPEGGESWYYSVSLGSCQPDPDNNPNVYLISYEIRQSDNYGGRDQIIFAVEHNPSSNTISLYNGDYYSLNGRGYRYGYVMGDTMSVIDANRVLHVTAEDDHTRNGPADYDPGLIVIKDET